MGRGRGKVFEGEVLRALCERYPSCYVERNHDRTIYGKPELSLPSPPDLIAILPHANYLIECKAKGGKSMPFKYSGGGDTLSQHQHDYLMQWENISDQCKAFVAVNLYNNKKGRFNRAWLVPIEYWSRYQSRYPRKSISIKHLEDDLPDHELIRLPGSKWELPSWV